MKTNSGGPAFPTIQTNGPHWAPAEPGMSLRDWFAGMALQGLLANPQLASRINKEGGATSGWIEDSAYAWANGMLKERAARYIPAATGVGINSLLLSTRAHNSLLAMGVYYIHELTALTSAELLARPNLGRTALKEYRAVLKARGLALKGEV